MDDLKTIAVLLIWLLLIAVSAALIIPYTATLATTIHFVFASAACSFLYNLGTDLYREIKKKMKEQ